jgi:glycosyltransferase involved in cell wall biosynthesis
VKQLAVLHLMNEWEDCSISRIVERLVQHLESRGYEWHIGALNRSGDMQEVFRRLGAQVVDFSKQTVSGCGSGCGIREYVTAHRIQVVHNHSPRTILKTALALAGGPPTTHLATKHLLNLAADRRWGLVYVLLDRLSMYLPNHLVAVSETMYGQLVAQPGVSRRRVTIIRNAVPCEHFYAPSERDACRAELGLKPETPTIGFTGRIEPMKRLDLLLEGSALVLVQRPDARLLIVGEGSLRPRLEALASRLGISRAVIWAGFRQDIPRLLAAMDIYVQPSSNEGLSLSILEAMAAGKAVIATNVGGAREVVSDNKTGILIPPGSAQAVGAAILALLDDPGKSAALAQTARADVVQRFHVQRMVGAYGQLYDMLASGAGSQNPFSTNGDKRDA